MPDVDVSGVYPPKLLGRTRPFPKYRFTWLLRSF